LPGLIDDERKWSIAAIALIVEIDIVGRLRRHAAPVHG
jgi:hypothetical protein